MYVLRTSGSNSLGDVAFWIVDVAEVASMSATGFHASWKRVDFLKVTAKGALLNDLGVRIVRTGAIWAGGHAHSAADALLVVDENLAIVRVVGRASRANLNARCLAAVLADSRQVVHVDIRIFADRTNGQNLVVVHAQRNIVLVLACHLACIATNAAVQVNN